MKSYNETKKEIKSLVEKHGISGIKNQMLNDLKANGHDTMNIIRVFNFFQCRSK